MTIIPREIVSITISLGKSAYVFPRFYGSNLSCFNVHAPTCTKDTIICIPNDKMASAENLNWLELLLRTSSHIFSDFLDCLWYNKTLIYWL